MKKSSSFVLSGLVLVGAKLALLPFPATSYTSLFSDLTDFLLAVLISVAVWQAVRRSYAFARALWLSIFIFSLLETIYFGIGALIYALVGPEKGLNAFWAITIIPYLIFVTLLVPLLLREDLGALAIGWRQTLDLAQFGILTLSAYLVFFYIPAIQGSSNDRNARNFMILHLLRDGFLALGFLYRGWRSQFPDLRRLHFRLAAFFLGFGVTACFYLPALNVWRWPQPLITFISNLPFLFLLLTAVGWRPQAEAPPLPQILSRRGGIRWNLLFPLLLPFSVIALASRISTAHPRIAWSAITLSFVGYAARLLVMQRGQDAVLSRLSLMEEKFSKAFQSSPVAIAISRLSDGRYVDVNDRCLKLLHLAREQVIGKTSLDLGIFARVEDRNRMVDAILKHHSFRSRPFKLRTASRVLDTLISTEIIQLENESLLISSVLDVTELNSVTRQLQQAQKMELVGTLAGGVAHDFNNLLTIIKGYSELARMRGLKPDLAEEIRQIGEAADRAAALTRQLLAFSRRQLLQPRNIGLNSVVAGIEKMLRRTIGENIELVNSCAHDLGTVHADPVQMEQVVINLAVNSRDAMPNGGKLLFQTKNLELSSPYPEIGFEVPEGRYVVLTVTDTGTGIAPENLERVFEPFFTTKAASQGTGLGLPTVYGIVKQSGGYISVHSKVGWGTTVKIYLPRVDRPAEALRPDPVNTECLDGTETILITEDDQRVCELAANILGRCGYKVLAANSGEEALRCATEFEGEIHLLLTDVIMTATSGNELAQKLKEMRPGMKVLYMSGYPLYSLSGGTVMIDFHEPILTKPFTPSELAQAARKVLDGETRPAQVACG